MRNNNKQNIVKNLTTNPNRFAPAYCKVTAIPEGIRMNGKMYKSCNPNEVLTHCPKAITNTPNKVRFPKNSNRPTRNPTYGPINPLANPYTPPIDKVLIMMIIGKIIID